MNFRDWSLLRFYLIWIYRGRPAAKKAEYPTDPGKAWLIQKGEVRMLVSGKETVAKAGEWVFPPIYLDEREFSDNAEIFSVRFCMLWPDGQDVFNYPEPIVCHSKDLPDLTELTIRLDERVSRVSRNRGKEIRYLRCNLSEYMEIEGLVGRWISEYTDCLVRLGFEPRTPETSDALLEEVRRRIEALPAEMSFNRQHLAESVGMSLSHLESVFAKQFNKTPTQYWQDCRFQKARDLLRTQKGPIKQVAFGLGFKSVARFSTWFRQQAGCSPSEFTLR